MAERTNAVSGLIDGMTADLGGPRTTAVLARLERAVPWMPRYQKAGHGTPNAIMEEVCQDHR